MFGPKQYMPILRWKMAEKLALRDLRQEDRSQITPLIEFTPKMFDAPRQGKKKGVTPNPSEVLLREAKDLLANWGYSPFFLDLQHLDGNGPVVVPSSNPLIYLANKVRDYRLLLIPVTGLKRTDEHQSAVANVAATDRRGVCLRLTPSDVLGTTFHHDLKCVLQKLGTKKSDMDLLLDCGVSSPKTTDLGVLFDRIRDLTEWRSLTAASGSFPKDLQQYRPGSHEILRNDWLSWKQLTSGEQRITRKPSFADYTIQYGHYVEPVENCNPSASIRYTLEDRWLIMRGEGLLNEKGPGGAQYTANAILLRDRAEFYGAGFSEGDAYIFDMSNRTDKCGNPRTWIQAGLNHHMTVVSRQIANLADP
jgi:hypothetical protein